MLSIVGILTGLVFTYNALYQRKSLEALRQTPEYQFIVVDDSIHVENFGEHVGTVKIEGELKELIDNHNR
jgi:hypothetical protein